MRSMESRHEEATDQLSKLYQRKLSYESDRAFLAAFKVYLTFKHEITRSSLLTI